MTGGTGAGHSSATEQSEQGPSATARDVHHALHSSLFAIDVAVRSMALADDSAERAQLGRAVHQELEQAHALARQLSAPPHTLDESSQQT